MSASFRPCWNCDYLLPANTVRQRCSECGLGNDFAAIDAEVQAAFAAPVRTLLRGRVLSGDLLRKAWRASSCTSAKASRWIIVALIAGLVLPVAMSMTSAAIGLKTTVQCTPHAVTEVDGQPLCSPYHRPQFIEYNCYGWAGWFISGDQKDKWASLGFLPFERVDRVLVSRSIVLSRKWSFQGGMTSDLVWIAPTIVSWWLLAAAWLAWARRRIRRTAEVTGAHSSIGPDLKRFCALVLASSGILLTAILVVDLLIRLSVPQFGVGGHGQWYSVSARLPWSIAIPALLFWRVSAKGPPGVARWVSWPTLAIGAVIAFAVRLFIRMRPESARLART